MGAIVWPPGMRERILERDGHRCVRCRATEPLEVDHIVPRWRGGPAIDENLQTLCRPCNQAKRHEDGWGEPGARACRPLGPISHGTAYAYGRRKCRCVVCRAGSAARRRRARERARTSSLA